jgi:hypothetical protein
MVECPSKPIDAVLKGPATNKGAVCMPYFGYAKAKSIFKYNGPGTNGHGYGQLWTTDQQCLANDCVTITSKANCAATPALQPCVCYDSCPTGRTFFPFMDEWTTNSLAQSAARLDYIIQ